MNGNLDKLIQFISKHVVFDENSYPELKDLSKEKKIRFAINHSALHFAKTAGKMAAISENVDHGGELDIVELKKQLVKSLINFCWISEKIDVKEKDILDAIQEKYKEKI